MNYLNYLLEKYSNFNRKLSIALFILGIFLLFSFFIIGFLDKNISSLILVLSAFSLLLSLICFSLFVFGEKLEDEDNVFIKIQENSDNLLKKRLNTKIVALERHKE